MDNDRARSIIGNQAAAHAFETVRFVGRNKRGRWRFVRSDGLRFTRAAGGETYISYGDRPYVCAQMHGDTLIALDRLAGLAIVKRVYDGAYKLNKLSPATLRDVAFFVSRVSDADARDVIGVGFISQAIDAGLMAQSTMEKLWPSRARLIADQAAARNRLMHAIGLGDA